MTVSAACLAFTGGFGSADAAPDVSVDAATFLSQAAMAGFNIALAVQSCAQDSDSTLGGFIAITLTDPITAMKSTTKVNEECGVGGSSNNADTADALASVIQIINQPYQALGLDANPLRNILMLGGLIARIKELKEERENALLEAEAINKEFQRLQDAIGVEKHRQALAAEVKELQQFGERNPEFKGEVDDAVAQIARIADGGDPEKFDPGVIVVDFVQHANSAKIAAEQVREAEQRHSDLQSAIERNQNKIDNINAGTDELSVEINQLEARLSVTGLSAATPFAPLSVGANSLSFGFSMQQMHAFAAAKRVPAGSDGAGLFDDQSSIDRRWDVFVSGNLIGFDDGNDRDGVVGSITGGAGYLIRDTVAAGAFLSYKGGNVSSNSANAQLTSNFIGGGLFINALLGGRLMLDGLVSYDHGWNDISIAGATGDFSIDAFTVAGSLSRRSYLSQFTWVAPKLTASYSIYDRSGYTDSTGTAVAGSDLQQGRLSAGPEIGHTIFYKGGRLRQIDLEGRAAIVWDFVNQGDFQLAGGALVKSADFGGSIGGSISALFDNGMRAGASFDVLGQNNNFWSYSGTVSLKIPF
jgi:hypothetical protein